LGSELSCLPEEEKKATVNVFRQHLETKQINEDDLQSLPETMGQLL
jgi:hypothetical protein